MASKPRFDSRRVRKQNVQLCLALAVTSKALNPVLASQVYHNPFSLGGERQKAVRSEDLELLSRQKQSGARSRQDNDCRAAEADPLFPSTWVMPLD